MIYKKDKDMAARFTEYAKKYNYEYSYDKYEMLKDIYKKCDYENDSHFTNQVESFEDVKSKNDAVITVSNGVVTIHKAPVPYPAHDELGQDIKILFDMHTTQSTGLLEQWRKIKMWFGLGTE